MSKRGLLTFSLLYLIYAEAVIKEAFDDIQHDAGAEVIRWLLSLSVVAPSGECFTR